MEFCHLSSHSFRGCPSTTKTTRTVSHSLSVGFLQRAGDPGRCVRWRASTCGISALRADSGKCQTIQNVASESGIARATRRVRTSPGSVASDLSVSTCFATPVTGVASRVPSPGATTSTRSRVHSPLSQPFDAVGDLGGAREGVVSVGLAPGDLFGRGAGVGKGAIEHQRRPFGTVPGRDRPAGDDVSVERGRLPALPGVTRGASAGRPVAASQPVNIISSGAARTIAAARIDRSATRNS